MPTAANAANSMPDDGGSIRRTLSDPQAQVASATIRPAARLGRYILLDRLGQGGMGEVYRAFDPDLERMVAVKRLRGSEPLGARARSRLLREAQVVARLSHVNVVQVFDVGVDEPSDDAYVVMELVEGTTLRTWLRQGQDWPTIVATFIEAGRGLAAAHARGVVHRDFKPENVLLDHTGAPKVVDFGLAKPARDPRVSRSSGDLPIITPDEIAARRRTTERDLPIVGGQNAITPEGARLGTPAYMPPEQVRSEPSDPRSDQFSFCVSLYEALTGRLPFAGKTARKYALAVLDGAVRPFPARSPVPRSIQRAVLRGLSFDADDRFVAMTDLLDALQLAPGRPRWWRSPVFVAAAAGLGIGAAVTSWLHLMA